MSTEYKAICDTCKQYLDLDKLEMWLASYEKIESEDCKDLYERGVFIYMCCRLLKFLGDHKGHTIRIEEWNVAWDTAVSLDYESIAPLWGD